MKKVKAFSLVLMLLFMGIGLADKSQASSKTNWDLRYVKGAPTSEYKDSDEVWAEARGKANYMTVDSISGGASVWMKIDFGGSANGETFSRKGQTMFANTPRGVLLSGHVHYVKYGNNTNYPKGRLVR